MLRFWLRTAIPALCAFMIASLAVSAVVGPNGLRADAALQRERDSLRREVAELEAHRAELRLVADQLNSGSLDPDMIDEKIRAVLGYAAPGDYVVPKAEFERMLESARAAAQGP